MKSKRQPAAGTQLATVLTHLRTNKSITQVECQGLYSISQVACCVYRLKNRGYAIDTTMKQGVRGSYARYSLQKGE